MKDLIMQDPKILRTHNISIRTLSVTIWSKDHKLILKTTHLIFLF